MSYNINLIKSFTLDSGLTLKGVGLLQVQMGSSTTMRNELVEILKIKCPYSARDTTPVQAAEKLPSFFCKVVNGNLSLKKNHNYYFQVQGQLAITHANWCDFCVYTPHGFSIERITFDKSFWKSVVHKLDEFYFKYIIPTLSNIPSTKELL